MHVFTFAPFKFCALRGHWNNKFAFLLNYKAILKSENVLNSVPFFWINIIPYRTGCWTYTDLWVNPFPPLDDMLFLIRVGLHFYCHPPLTLQTILSRLVNMLRTFLSASKMLVLEVRTIFQPWKIIKLAKTDWIFLICVFH